MTNEHINIDALANTIQYVLAEYAGATDDAIERAVDLTSAEIVDELRTTSPRRPGGGDYARSWTDEVWQKKLKGKYSKLISNKEHYQLTHLLENGHRIMRNGREVGYSAARPHIMQARNAAAEKLAHNVARELEK